MLTPTYEAAIRFGCFLGTLLAMNVWEFLAPRRPLTQSRSRRWFSNLGLAGLNGVVWRLLMPAGAVGIAIAARGRGWGLFNHVSLTEWLEVSLTVVILDLAIYAQHWAFHHVPWLWRLHLVHHVDLDFDASTGVRFHTIETLLSFGWKAVAVVSLGASPLAVMIFEVLLNASSLFSHGNVRLPTAVDRALRWFLVTPDMHRVHHSVENPETNSNYGFCLPWWDRLFGTYHAQPQAGHEQMTVGRSDYQDANVDRLSFMLRLPFQRERPQPPCRQRHSIESESSPGHDL